MKKKLRRHVCKGLTLYNVPGICKKRASVKEVENNRVYENIKISSL